MPYIYQAEIWCDKCGERIRAELTAQGKAPENPSQEWTYDAADFPKWAGYEWGSDADRPQNCADGKCGGEYYLHGLPLTYGTFLRNDLTTEGYRHLKSMLDKRGGDLPPFAKEWADYYHFTYHKNEWESPQQWLKETLTGLEKDLSQWHYDTWGKVTELAEYAITMATALDADQIQDLFQSDMEKDGYFKKSGWYSPEMTEQ